MVREHRAPGRPSLLLLGLSLLPLVGCAGPRLPAGPAPRVGQVYCLRGLIDVFSLGLNDLNARLQAEGVRSTVMSGSRWRTLAADLAERPLPGRNSPIVLIGHSYGADNAVRLSRDLHELGINVELLVMLDATAPPPIPANVKRCVHYYRPSTLGEANPALFAGNPVVLEDGNRRTELVNTVVSTESLGPQAASVGHFNIDASACIHEAVLGEVLRVCRVRTSSGAGPPNSPAVAVPASKPKGPPGARP